VIFTINLHVVTRLKMNGSILLLPSTRLRGADRDDSRLYFTRSSASWNAHCKMFGCFMNNKRRNDVEGSGRGQPAVGSTVPVST